MSHDDNFERLDVDRGLCVGWSMHRACAPSNIDRNLVVSGIHRRLPNCLEWNRVATVERGPAALAMRSLQTLRQ